MKNKNYLTTREFGDAIGVSVSCLHNWNEKGILKPAFITPTRRLLYTQAQVDEFFSKCRNKTDGSEK